MTHIKGILFDLGGVVLDIDPQRTIQALVKLGYANAENEISKSHHKGPFIQFEEGVITEQEFVSAIQAKLPKAVDNQLILEAWGQMFVGLPKERIELILKLKEQFTVMVLSNTNSFHIREFYAMGSHLTNMNDLFHHKFFSFEQKCSKPTELIYEKVLAGCGIKAEEIFFLDDSLLNVDVAKSLGFEAAHINEDNDMLKVINDRFGIKL